MSPRSAEIIVLDEPEPCPYLPGETARLPLRLPLEKLSPAQFDARLAAGDRRSGPLLYTPHCPQCCACQSLRLDVNAFVPSRTQARVFKRGQSVFRAVVQTPRVDDQRLALYNRHRNQRDLVHGDPSQLDWEGYEQFLVISCCDTREIAYYHQDRLAMVAIIDVGHTSVSAVYTYFDPDLSRLSPGVYSVLYEIELCRAWRIRWLYLGYYVAGSRHMTYKATYRPHERRIDGQWQPFAR
jgi:arginine-tRNA-protein transferase